MFFSMFKQIEHINSLRMPGETTISFAPGETAVLFAPSVATPGKDRSPITNHTDKGDTIYLLYLKFGENLLIYYIPVALYLLIVHAQCINV